MSPLQNMYTRTSSPETRIWGPLNYLRDDLRKLGEGARWEVGVGVGAVRKAMRSVFLDGFLLGATEA